MSIAFTAQAELWGGWRFGDLGVAVCRAVEVVGPAADVLSMSVSAEEPGPAKVRLWVPDANEAARLRFETENCEYVASSWEHADAGWTAVVNGIRLQVAVTGEES